MHRLSTFVTALALGLALSLWFALPAVAAGEQALVDKSRITVEAAVTDREMVNMRAYLKQAKGVMIVPQLLKAGFIVGGSGGSGVLVAHDPSRQAWSAPAFITMGTGSVGMQFGAQTQEIILLIMTAKGMDAVLRNKFTLGGEASIAVGPTGMGAEAATTTGLGADIYAYGRTKGLFVGLALEGAVIQTRESMNEAYYGRPTTLKEILFDWSADHPGAQGLKRALTAAAAAG